ncbi:MAG: DNA polymerase III subunit delta', partial [Coriobacteriales bacterium]|nr:DNA polymerase III subunit delta' [Coriobacteriales bacterium]
AYLFVGPIGSGKTEAAVALAQALLCKDGGCGSCDDCLRVSRRTHPDLHIVEPLGAGGYLVDQMHALIHDASLAPMRSSHKIYLITRADLLRGHAANAFLKTLEEPTASVVFILLARTRESVFEETLLSRCLVVSFRAVPEIEAIHILTKDGHILERDARVALASTGGSVLRAREFLGSSTHRALRLAVLETIEQLTESDALDVIRAALDLTVALKAPLDEVKAEQERQLEEAKDFFTKGALSTLEQRHKQALTARTREMLGETFNIMRSWLRDCLLVRIGHAADMVNTDFHYNIEKTAALTLESAFVRSLAAVDEAQEHITYNVSPQSTLESLLLTIRDELTIKEAYV